MLLQAVPKVYRNGLRPFGAHVVGHTRGAGLAVRTPESKSKLQASLQAVQGLTLLPDDAKALSEILTQIEQQYGLVLSPAKADVTKDGRFSVSLSASDMLMINVDGVPASAPAPYAVLQDAVRLFKAHKNWHSADSADGKTITVTTTHQENTVCTPPAPYTGDIPNLDIRMHPNLSDHHKQTLMAGLRLYFGTRHGKKTLSALGRQRHALLFRGVLYLKSGGRGSSNTITIPYVSASLIIGFDELGQKRETSGTSGDIREIAGTIAHEFGHTRLHGRMSDHTGDRMDNVNANENPVRKELCLAPRVAYS